MSEDIRMKFNTVLAAAVLLGLTPKIHAQFLTSDETASASWQGSNGSFGDVITSVGDINGDGFDDIIMSDEPGSFMPSETAWLILGTDQPLSLDQDPALTADASFSFSGYFPNHVSGLGDVNGDGFDDFMLGNYSGYSLQGQSFLILGRAAADWGTDFNVGTSADAIFQGTIDDFYFGTTFRGIGDVNNDNIDDFMISEFSDGIFIFLGRSAADWGMSFPSSSADASFEYSGSLSSRVGVGDFNNDGLSDIVMNANGFLIIEHGADPFDWGTGVMTPADAEALFSDNGFSPSETGTGDFNGDGVDDLLLANSSNAGTVAIIPGNAITSSTSSVLDHVSQSFSGFDNGQNILKTLAWAGDTNGDGRDDFITGDESYSSSAFRGVAVVQHGFINSSSTSSLLVADYGVLGNADGDQFGNRTAPAGDFNGDGVADFLISAAGTGFSGGEGSVYLYASGTYQESDFYIWLRKLIPTGSSTQEFTTAGASVEYLSNDTAGELTVGILDEAPGNLAGSYKRTWDVSGPGGTFSCNLSFEYDDSVTKGSVVDEADYVLWKSSDSGTSWQEVPSSVDTVNNVVSTTSPQSSFSLWGIAPADTDVENWMNY